MKIRSGFVSNSSSSSFIIKLEDISALHLALIQDHATYGQVLGMDCCDCPWSIEVIDGVVKGRTSLDNFDMQEFFRKLGIPDDKVAWVSYYTDYA